MSATNAKPATSLPMQTLDWQKLERFIEERKPVEVSAGLLDDWFWTGATVYKDGEWQDRDAAYVTSYWATPGFKAEMSNGDIIEIVASTEETAEQAAKREEKAKKTREAIKEMAASIRADKESA